MSLLHDRLGIKKKHHKGTVISNQTHALSTTLRIDANDSVYSFKQI